VSTLLRLLGYGSMCERPAKTKPEASFFENLIWRSSPNIRGLGKINSVNVSIHKLSQARAEVTYGEKQPLSIGQPIRKAAWMNREPKACVHNCTSLGLQDVKVLNRLNNLTTFSDFFAIALPLRLVPTFAKQPLPFRLRDFAGITYLP
jgi:hypothetical protein